MRGGRGMTASLEPLPSTVTIRWPRSAPRSSMSIEHASETRRPSRPSRPGEGVVGGASRCPAGDEGAQLHAVEAERGRIGADLRAVDELSRGVGQQSVDHGEAVEARDGGQSPSDRGPGEAPLLHRAGPQLEVSPTDGEHVESLIGAPGEVLAQVGGVGGAGRARVAGQEADDGEAGLVERRWGGDGDGGGHGTSLVWLCPSRHRWQPWRTRHDLDFGSVHPARRPSGDHDAEVGSSATAHRALAS